MGSGSFLQGTKHPVTTINSSDLEKAYQAFLEPDSGAKVATLKFQAGKHKYELDFKGIPDPWLIPDAGLGWWRQLYQRAWEKGKT